MNDPARRHRWISRLIPTEDRLFRSEGSALSWIKSRVAKDTVLNADEAPSWNDLHARFEMHRCEIASNRGSDSLSMMPLRVNKIVSERNILICREIIARRYSLSSPKNLSAVSDWLPLVMPLG